MQHLPQHGNDSVLGVFHTPVCATVGTRQPPRGMTSVRNELYRGIGSFPKDEPGQTMQRGGVERAMPGLMILANDKTSCTPLVGRPLSTAIRCPNRGSPRGDIIEAQGRRIGDLYP